MYRFVAVIWNARNSSASSAADRFARRFSSHAPTWSSVFRENGIIVYALPPQGRSLQAILLPGGRGVVLGTIFATGVDATESGQAAPNDAAAHRLVSSRGRAMTREYWGAYVAFLWDVSRHTSYVIRDCSGKIPCYWTCHEGVHVLFSDIADVLSLDFRTFTINRTYLAAFIYSPELQIRSCALNEITEILAGECLELEHNSANQIVLWDPARVYRDRNIDDYRDAVVELRATVQKCISAWSSIYDNILLRLSGGLDSAIVLGCLRDCRTADTITCANIFGEYAAEDERYYARIAAARWGVKLVEQESAKHAFDERQFARPLTPKPAVTPLFATLERTRTNQIVAESGAETIWTGQGGDHLFMQLHTSLGAVDYVMRHGIGRGFPRAVADAAHLSREPYWHVLRSALEFLGADTERKSKSMAKHEFHFVREEALPPHPEEYTGGPWAALIESLPRGKQAQAYFLSQVLNRHRPLPRFEAAHEHHPLLSQPIIDLCLQIPTYLLTRGGRDRALARDAFEYCIPTEILQREDKGEISFAVTDAIRRSKKFLSHTLMDGYLVNERIVSKTALEKYITRGESLRVDNCRPLLACIAAEIWARTWSDNFASLPT